MYEKQDSVKKFPLRDTGQMYTTTLFQSVLLILHDVHTCYCTLHMHSWHEYSTSGNQLDRPCQTKCPLRDIHVISVTLF